MTSTFMILIVLAAVLWIFSTTPAGRQVLEWFQARRGGGLPGPRASDEDHQFLLRICGGDYAEVGRRLEGELRLNPHLSEREAYRRAIRRHMKQN